MFFPHMQTALPLALFQTALYQIISLLSLYQTAVKFGGRDVARERKGSYKKGSSFQQSSSKLAVSLPWDGNA